MSCERCHDLCVTYQIRTPGELSTAIAIANANLQDGTLKELQASHRSFEPEISFLAIAAGFTWPDIVSFNFECNSCAERFALKAETYHGAGGHWKPLRTGASRESL